MNLMSSLNICAGALNVNEKAISVVSHNVANMNSEGYHKQRVNLHSRNIAGQIADNTAAQVRSDGGVKIANVMRYNSDYLDNYYRDQLSKQKYLEQQLGNLDELASIFDDLDGTGVDAALSDFYEALNNLNQYPASSTARTAFVESAKTLTSVMNSKSAQLDNLTGNALGDGESVESLKNSKIYNEYRNFNDILDELAAVNKALQQTQTGTLTANNLLDQRDIILNKIAEYVDITVDEKQNGSVTVSTGNVPLVKGAEVVGRLNIETAADYKERTGKTAEQAAVISIVSSEEGDDYVVDNANDILTGGSLGGLIHSADGNDEIDAGYVQDSLNKLAGSIATIFNDLNKRDYAYAINPENTNQLKESYADNIDIFTSLDGSDLTAGNITVNSKLLEPDGIWEIACAYFPKGEGFDKNAVGNAQNVGNSFVDDQGKPIGSFLGTRSQKQDELSGMSVEDYYGSLLGKIASAGDSAKTMYDTQCDVVDSLENQLASEYGVDLNEELVDLVKYQTAYAAAAQVFNVVNSCLDTLMALGR